IWTQTAMLNVPIVDDNGSGHFTFASKLSGGDVELVSDTTALLRMGGAFAAHWTQIAGDTRVVRDGEHLFSYVAPLTGVLLADAITKRLGDLPIVVRADQATTPSPAVAKVKKPRLDMDNPRVAGMLKIYAAAKQVIRLDVQDQDATDARAELNA